MRAYILSVVGMVILIVVVGLVLPEGKMSSYTKGILSLFLFFVVVSPIVQFFKKGNSVVEELAGQFDFSMHSSGTKLQIDGLKNQLQRSLKNNFGIESNVEIEYKEENGVTLITKTTIWVEETSENENRIEKQEVVSHAAALLKIEEDMVVIYE